jgi:hypothetical protein
MSSSADGPGLRSLLLEYCRVGKNLEKHEVPELQLLVELVKHHLRQKLLALLHEAEEGPVLYSYSADATPLRCSSTKIHAGAGGNVVRRGRRLEEFLLQRALLKTTLATGEQKVAFLLGDILPLSQGKKAPNVFTAMSALFPRLRTAGHTGICLQHVCADRALFSSLDRMSRQRLQAYYTPGVGPELGEHRTLQELTDWPLGTGCCAHDMQNALKWALASAASAEDLQSLHIVVESLRNSFDILLSRLPAFLSKHLVFVDPPGDTEPVATFWRNLGVEADMVDEVAEVNPWWAEGKLQVSSAVTQDPAGIEQVSHVLLYLCKWRQFSDSRWCTVGACCRSLLWGLCVGLEAWVALARADPTASDYYLHGFSRLTRAIKQYCVVASLSSYMPDTILAEVLADDRILRHASRLQELMVEEMGWVENVESFTWCRLAAASGYRGEVWELRDSVVRSSHVAASFIDGKVLGQLREYPWRLAVGDVAENLARLAATEEPIRDSCTHKVRLLLRMGYNRDRLVAAVSLFREIPWSSVHVEQAHASAAVLHKYHPEYSVAMLATRATLHHGRHFFLQPPEERVLGRADKKLDTLTRKAPEKVSGKHAFLAHLFEEAKEAVPRGAKLPTDTVRRIIAQHSRMFTELPLAGQAAFHKEARDTAAGRATTIQEDIEHLQTAARLGRARLSEELLTEGVRNKVIGSRFATEDFQSMEQFRHLPDFRGPEVARRRAAATQAPSAPPPDILAQFAGCPIYAAPLPDETLPKWLKAFCWQRDAIRERGVAVTTSLDEGGLAFYCLPTSCRWF